MYEAKCVVDLGPDVRSRARARVKTNANSSVAVRDKGGLDINILNPFLYDNLDFPSLNSVPTDEGVVSSFFVKVTVNLGELKHAEAGVTTYTSVVLQSSGLGNDSPHRTTRASDKETAVSRHGSAQALWNLVTVGDSATADGSVVAIKGN